jgi:hypothetical protein
MAALQRCFLGEDIALELLQIARPCGVGGWSQLTVDLGLPSSFISGRDVVVVFFLHWIHVRAGSCGHGRLCGVRQSRQPGVPCCNGAPWGADCGKGRPAVRGDGSEIDGG